MEKEAQLVSQQHAQMIARLQIARMEDQKRELEITIDSLSGAMETTRGEIAELKK